MAEAKGLNGIGYHPYLGFLIDAFEALAMLDFENKVC